MAITQLIYFRFIEEVTDPRMLALQSLERDIVCKAHHYTIHHHHPEDLAQELRILIWESLPKFNSQKASIRTWANTVMENRLKNIYKRECSTQKRKDYLAVSFEEEYDVDLQGGEMLYIMEETHFKLSDGH